MTAQPSITFRVSTHDSEIIIAHNQRKTIADCFKYRNKIGLDIAIEALKLYRERKRFKRDDLVKFSQVCRVGQIMRPYLEALL